MMAVYSSRADTYHVILILPDLYNQIPAFALVVRQPPFLEPLHINIQLVVSLVIHFAWVRVWAEVVP